MPIANATAIIQVIPLAITLAAALCFGEQVGWRRYSAIAVGFAGVLVIVRPGAEGFNAYAFWAVSSEGHTSELQSLMRISYSVFCFKKNTSIMYDPKTRLCNI